MGDEVCGNIVDLCFLIAQRQRTDAMAVPCVEEEGDLVHRQAKEVPSSPSPWGTTNPKLARTWTKRGQRTGRRTWRPSAAGTTSLAPAVGTERQVRAVVAVVAVLVVFGVGRVFDGLSKSWESTLNPCC